MPATAAPADDQSRFNSLSPREREVLIGLATGQTNRELAELLSISVKTVDTHRGHVLKKLGARNNSDMTRFAIRVGQVTP
jgi:DNA-binding NarL/FixJ family response regulator